MRESDQFYSFFSFPVLVSCCSVAVSGQCNGQY